MSLAGWLFADLALVLFVIFLPSSVSSDDLARAKTRTQVTTTTSTTTTVPSTIESGRGVRPEPIELRVVIPGSNPSRGEVIGAIERALLEQDLAPTTQFGVVRVLAGIEGQDTVDARNAASRRAGRIAQLLEEEAKTTDEDAGRLKPWLYTDSGSDASLLYPAVKLRMFPDND